MKNVSLMFMFGALVLVLALAACAPSEGTPTLVGSPFPDDTPIVDLTGSPSVEATGTTVTTETETPVVDTTDTPEVTPTQDTTQTPSIPVTGDIILVECQFCIENVGHALLVFNESSTFEVVTTSASTPSDPDMGCSTIDTYDGRQVVLCRGEEDTSLTLNICDANNTCTEMIVTLQGCPDALTPQPGDATNTPAAGVATDTPAAGATDTPAAAVPTATPTP